MMEEPTKVDLRDVTVFLRFTDDSKAIFRHGEWRAWDPWHGRYLDPEAYPQVDYFTESMAAEWSANWREICPDIVGIGTMCMDHQVRKPNMAERSLIWETAARLHPLDAGVDTFADTVAALASIYLAFRDGT